MAKTQVSTSEVTTKSKKYADMIFPDEKQVKSAEKLEAVEDGEANMYNALVQARKNVRAAQKAYDLAKRTVPFDPIRTLIKKDELAGANETVSALEALKEELF